MTDEFGGIAEDGYWGRETTKAAQQTWGVPATGRIRHQLRSERRPETTSGWEFDDDARGDALLRALQVHYGLAPTGHLDQHLVNAFIARMQAGVSEAIVTFREAILEFQRRLNTGDAAGT